MDAILVYIILVVMLILMVICTIVDAREREDEEALEMYYRSEGIDKCGGPAADFDLKNEERPRNSKSHFKNSFENLEK